MVLCIHHAFSCGGRILGDRRSSLNPEMLEALVCAKDCLYKPKQTNNEGKMVKFFTNLAYFTFNNL
jgi:hypothetical protein